MEFYQVPVKPWWNTKAPASRISLYFPKIWVKPRDETSWAWQMRIGFATWFMDDWERKGRLGLVIPSPWILPKVGQSRWDWGEKQTKNSRHQENTEYSNFLHTGANFFLLQSLWSHTFPPFCPSSFAIPFSRTEISQIPPGHSPAEVAANLRGMRRASPMFDKLNTIHHPFFESQFDYSSLHSEEDNASNPVLPSLGLELASWAFRIMKRHRCHLAPFLSHHLEVPPALWSCWKSWESAERKVQLARMRREFVADILYGKSFL